jgi:hypothetical protein
MAEAEPVELLGELGLGLLGPRPFAPAAGDRLARIGDVLGNVQG